MLVKVVADVVDLTGDNSIHFETAKIPPPADALLKMSKRNLNKSIAPWQSGYSISSQSKPYLVDYARVNWKDIMVLHVKEINKHREVKLMRAYFFKAVDRKGEDRKADR